MKTHKMVDLHITCEVLLASITMGRNVSTRYIQEPKARLEMHQKTCSKQGLFVSAFRKGNMFCSSAGCTATDITLVCVSEFHH